mgnify:CR=1 FL=1
MRVNIKQIWNSEFGKDVIITILGQVIVLLIIFAINKLLSIKLGPSGFGEFNISKRFGNVVSYFLLAGLGIAIPKYLATYRRLGDRVKETRFVITAIIFMICLSLLITCILIILQGRVAKLLFNDNGYSSFILPILLFSLTSAFASFVYAYYRGLDRVLHFNIHQIIVNIISFFAVLFIDDVISLLYAWSFIFGGYGFYKCTKIIIKSLPIANIKSYDDIKPIIKEIISYCIPRVPGELIWITHTIVPLIIINYKQGIETSAYFAVAISINAMFTPFFSFAGMVLLPFVSKSVVSDEFSKAESKIKDLAKLYFIIGIVGVIIVEIFTPYIVNLLFSNEYQPSVPIVRITIISIIPSILYLLLRSPLDAMSKIPYNTINLIISFIVLNILTFLASNITAYALSYVIAYSILGAFSILAWQNCKKKISKSNIASNLD